MKDDGNEVKITSKRILRDNGLHKKECYTNSGYDYAENESKQSDGPTHSRLGQLPINKVGIISYMFASWFSEIVLRIFRNRKRVLTEDDIWECSEEEGVHANKERVQKLWDEELTRNNKETVSFLKVWMRFTSSRCLLALFLLSLYATSSFASTAFLLNRIVRYLESNYDDVAYGIGLTIAVFCCEMVRALSNSNLILLGSQIGTRFRSGVVGVVYDKLLKMKSINGQINSEILNVFSVDAHRVYMTTKSAVFLIGFPIYIVIGTVYCCILIGYWGLLSVGTFIACFVMQNYMGRFIASFRKKCVQYSDQRIRRMGEIINNIKFIKMYGWENPFTDTIKGERRLESKHLLNVNILTGIIISLVPVTPTIASVVTITAYAASGNVLTASTVFSVIGTMNFLREIFARIPLSLKAFAEAKVSMGRIQRLLLMDEYTTPSAHVSSTDTAVEIYNADFVWDLTTSTSNYNKTVPKEGETYSARNYESNNNNGSEKVELLKISFEAKKGTLIGVCGAVGSGKSALMSAILGRMDKTRGHLAVNGNVAYVAQQAWIFNGSLKENILFGEELDLKRFNEIIRCCCLETDIRALPDGIDTEIGERGTNLSGGQKQRVSLARAIYSNRDIYILDDPFSALDAKIGKHIFQICIKRLLKTKTILLVTHHLQYLKYCDEVVVMDERAIAQQGQHDELLRQTGLYSDLFQMFGSHNRGMDKGVIAPTDKDDVNDCTCMVGMENDIHKTTCNFIEQEHCAVGAIGMNTYRAYIQAAGGWCIGGVVVMLHMVSSASIIFADWWISKWINAHDFVGISENTSIATNISSTNCTIYMNITHSKSDLLATNVVSDAQDVFSFIRYNTYIVVYATSLVGIFSVQLIKSFVEAKVALKASDHLHERCLKSVMTATTLFFDSNPSGRILNRFSRDLDELDVYLVQTTQELLYCFTMTFLSMTLSVYVTPWLLLSVVPITLLFCALRQVSSVSIRQLKRFENIARSPLMSEVATTASGLTTIVTYGQQKRFTERCFRAGDTASISLFLFDVGVRWIVIRLDLIAGALAVSTTLLFVLNKGLISPATAGLVLGLLGKTISIIQLLIKLTNNAEAHFTAVERMREYDTNIELEPQGAIEMANDKWHQSGKIVFKDVVMRYRKDLEPALRSVSFEINPGEKLGIVGRTGAGKSTLTTALFRLVEICGGSIMVDNVDISNLHLGEIRSKMAIITQTPVLFAGTIRYNIDPYYRCSDETIWSALQKVHMKQKVSQLHHGIDTVIEENGENFSVGERQLLCLARAIVRCCKILILDEATANVDISMDIMIQQTIQECFTDCTVMIIAHRLSTVLQCDRIVVLEEGQVVESGSPQELISNEDSRFAAMISAQVKT